MDPIDLATPRLTNGELKICALNSSFLMFLRAYPNIQSVLRRDRMPGYEDSLAYQIQKVLSSQDKHGTNLLGVKGVLSKFHPDTVAYQMGERGGDVLESFPHLVGGFIQETGDGRDRWKHSRMVTEEKGFPDTCCGQNLTLSCTKEVNPVFIAAQNTAEGVLSVQGVIDRWERKEAQKVREATCPTCAEKKAIQAMSVPHHMPKLFTVSFAPHACTVMDLTSQISWGGSTYRVTAIIHHGDDHFWSSLMDNGHEEHWWMLDDYCKREDTWRRRYVDSVGGLSTRPDGGLTVHKLNEKIGLLLLEKTDAVHVDEMQVSICQNIPSNLQPVLSKYFDPNCRIVTCCKSLGIQQKMRRCFKYFVFISLFPSSPLYIKHIANFFLSICPLAVFEQNVLQSLNSSDTRHNRFLLTDCFRTLILKI